MPKITSTSKGRNQKGDQIVGYMSTEVKPHTASKASHSMKTFDVESKTPNPMRKTHQARNPAVSHSTVQVGGQLSEFNLQLQQIRDQEESVKKAIETSDMLLRLKGP